MQYSLGIVSVIEYVARHFAKRAPSSGYPSGLRRAPAGPAAPREPLPPPVEPLGHRLPLGERERLRALVDLDARNDALRGEQLRERRPVVRLLADRLVEQDDAADVLLGAGRREEEVA